jgi:hypothetical protein
MALIDVSAAFLSLELSDTFTVIRRMETLSQNGRSQLSTITFPQIRGGTIYPTGDNSLVRSEDFTNAAKGLTICTNFRIQMTSPGYQPDLIFWGGDYFIVRKINDYSRFGSGMIVAECSSVDSVDLPPSGEPYVSTVFWNNNGVLTLFPSAAVGWPTSPVGLEPGEVWNNGLSIGIVPGVEPNALAAPIFLNTPPADNLLALGAAGLPRFNPGPGTQQLWNNNYEVAVAAPLGPQPTMWSDGGVLTLVPSATAGWPISPLGLPQGALWSNGGAVMCISGSIPDPKAPPLYLGSVTAPQLLALGGSNLPVSAPQFGSAQIWLNGSQVQVA